MLTLAGKAGSEETEAASPHSREAPWIGEGRHDLHGADKNSGGSTLEFLQLHCSKEGLRTELEDTRQETDALMARRELEAGREAAAISRLTQERDDLRLDGRAKKRRLSEMEDELLKTQLERDTLARKLEEFSESSRLELEAVQAKATAERRKWEEEVAGLRRDLSSAQRLQPASASDEGESCQMLKARISELEGEVSSLRLTLQEAAPERELAVQLRARHAEYEAELKDSRKAAEELKSVREVALRLEQEVASQKAALDVRDKALRQAEEVAEGAASTCRDLGAFVAAAAEIVASAKQTCANDEGVSRLSAGKPSPLDLSLAWSRLQASWSKQRLEASDSQQHMEGAAARERHAQAEVRKLRADLTSAESQLEELQVQFRRASEENASLSARQAVLREALAGKVGSAPLHVPEADSAEAEGLRSKQAELEEILTIKRKALEDSRKEAELLRSEVLKLSDAEAKAVKLQRVNSELWQANKELESRAAELERQHEEDAEADYDRRTTKILHLTQGPFSRAAGGAIATDKSLARVGDLEHQQAARQLERFKKATKKYVQDFREGIYSLLGWKIEMKGEGSNLRWHLMSRYQEGQELVFQLQPASAGQPAEFCLLGTSWAEQLQGDRQAMAYLEIYSSIPGFLAHVTTDLLSQQTFTQ
eukprot:TRINITY_DN25552_c0_g1_i1.p1 TRINITY_DN25552_c0_g1~~TRINITY_DN25552_c0_g1_i1.p1  ORF type:complete len:698 (+),score=219.90 TRINITY_DN25552_c0_g1_i1:130-2094(+)